MSPTQDSLYPDDWRRVARHDWHRIHVLLRDSDPEGAGYFLQQSLEKYLKAYLLGTGWKLKKVHTLPSLLDEAGEQLQPLSRFRPLCERVTGFYITERYPQLGSTGLDLQDIRRELPEARELIHSLFPDEVLEGQ